MYFDAIAPAGFVANRGSDPSLNPVAGGAGRGGLSGLRRKQGALAFSRGQQLIRLIERKVGPMHFPLLQDKFERRGLIGRQVDAGARLSLIAHGTDSQFVLTGRQVRYPVLSTSAGQDADGNPGICISRLDKCALKRLAIGALDRARHVGPISECGHAENYNHGRGKFSESLHCRCPPFISPGYSQDRHQASSHIR
jgi:hypothetical protein